MSPGSFNRAIQAELTEVAERGIVSEAERALIAELYPATPWDVAVLARWFTILGAAGVGAGVLVLARHLGAPLRLAEVGCAASLAGLLLSARKARARGLVKVQAAAELTAGFGLQGLIVALAVDFSTGSRNWPLLVGLCATALLGLAYALGNRLVLIHALVNAFVWFGGETGYVSGWGAYWLGMTYPVRFLGVGVVSLGAAWVHARALSGARQAFSRVYAHFGLLVVHLALWFLSVFGYFEGEVRRDGTEGQRLLFSAVWALAALGGIRAAGALGQRVLRSYGLVFLIVNLYTFYFQFVAVRTAEAWFVHLLLIGGSLIGAGLWLEKRLRAS